MLTRTRKTCSLILTGLRPEYQNANGMFGFARDLLEIFLDSNEIMEVLKLDVNHMGQTISKVVLYSVGTRLRIYQ